MIISYIHFITLGMYEVSEPKYNSTFGCASLNIEQLISCQRMCGYVMQVSE